MAPRSGTTSWRAGCSISVIRAIDEAASGFLRGYTQVLTFLCCLVVVSGIHSFGVMLWLVALGMVWFLGLGMEEE